MEAVAFRHALDAGEHDGLVGRVHVAGAGLARTRLAALTRLVEVAPGFLDMVVKKNAKIDNLMQRSSHG